MIVDKYQYDCFLLKRNMKKNQRIIVLSYDELDEEAICKAVLKYNNNFLVVDSDDFIRNLGEHIFYNCNKNNVDEVMQGISDKEECERTYIICDVEKNDSTHFIIFIQEELLPKSYAGVNGKNYNYSFLKNKLVGYKPVKAYSFENQIVIKYSKKDYSIEIKKKSKYLIPFEGVGDLFMQYSILRKFIEDTASGYNLSMICIGNNGTVELLSTLLQPKIKLLHISTGAKYLDWCTLISRDCIYPLFTDFLEGCKNGGQYSEGEYHILDIIKDILKVDKEFDPYTSSEFLKQFILDNIPDTEKKYVDELFEKKEYIGFQYYTGSYDSENNVWYGMNGKNWAEEQAVKFTELCEAHGIPLLLLSNSPYKCMKGNQLEKMSLFGYVYAISKVKALVGIDSSAGHIASFFHKPNITVWGGQSPLKSWGAKVSFRPLCMNYSIISEDLNSYSISSDYVFEVLNKIINKEIILEAKILSYYDQKNIVVVRK